MRNKKQAIKPIDSPNFTYWQAFYLSLFSSRLYIDVMKRWKGFGVLYFLLLVSLISLFTSIRYISEFTSYVNDNYLYSIEHLPLIMLQNGNVSIDEPMPYFVKGKSGDDIIEIDTRRTIDTFPKNHPTLIFLVTKNKLLMRSPVLKFLNYAEKTEEPTYIETFDKHSNEVFSGKEWVSTSNFYFIKLLFSVFIYLGSVGAMFGLSLGLNVALSSIGRIISMTILKYSIDFKQSIRLAFVASTGPFCLVSIMNALGLETKLMGGPWYIGLVALYFSYGVICVKRESKILVLS